MHQRLPLLALLLAGAAHADIYKWTDASGQVHFGDNPNSKSAKVVNVQVNTYRNTVSTSPRPPAAKQVVLYSTSWCGYCKQARAYFQQNGISYTDRDIEKDPAAKRAYEQLQGHGVPLIMIGSQRLEGFNPESFAALYR